MAGLGGGVPYGYTWDPMRGVYTTPTSRAAADVQHAADTRPQFVTSPSGTIYRYDYNSNPGMTGQWTTVGQVDRGTGTASGGTASASADDAQRKAAIDSLMAQIRSMQGGYTAPQIPVVTSKKDNDPYDAAAENASYAAARERTGLAMQAALKGLHSSLAQRGIVGSGIDADKTADVYSGGLGDLAATDRQLAEQRADRAFTAEQSNTDRIIGQNEFNVGQQATALQAQQQQALARLQMMLSATGLY